MPSMNDATLGRFCGARFQSLKCCLNTRAGEAAGRMLLVTTDATQVVSALSKSVGVNFLRPVHDIELPTGRGLPREGWHVQLP